MLMVVSKVPTKTRLLPLTVASLQPCPIVIRSPFLAFVPLIMIPLTALAFLLTISLSPFLSEDFAENLSTAVISPVWFVAVRLKLLYRQEF